MKAKEALAMKDALHDLIEWAHNRHAGPMGAGVMFLDNNAGFALQIAFPEVTLSSSELGFFGKEYRVYSLNGSTPASFLMLEKVQKHLQSMGGQVVVHRYGASGLYVDLLIPLVPGDANDTAAKIRLVERELRGELKEN